MTNRQKRQQKLPKQLYRELQKRRLRATEKELSPIETLPSITDDAILKNATDCDYLALPNGYVAVSCQKIGSNGLKEVYLGLYGPDNLRIGNYNRYSNNEGSLFNPVLKLIDNKITIFYSIVRSDRTVFAIAQIDFNNQEILPKTGLFTFINPNPSPKFRVEILSNNGFIVVYPDSSNNLNFREYGSTRNLVASLDTAIPFNDKIQFVATNFDRQRVLFYCPDQNGITQYQLLRSLPTEPLRLTGTNILIPAILDQDDPRFKVTSSPALLPNLNPSANSYLIYLTYQQSGIIKLQAINPNGSLGKEAMEVTHPESPHYQLEFISPIEDGLGGLIVAFKDVGAIARAIIDGTYEPGMEEITHAQLVHTDQLGNVFTDGWQFEIPENVTNIIVGPHINLSHTDLLLIGNTPGEISRANLDCKVIPSASNSPTPSATIGSSRSASKSASPSRSPSSTPTITPTKTSSLSSTRTATSTASISSTRTITKSKSPTVTTTKRPSESMSAKVSPTQIASQSVAPESPFPSNTFLPAPSLEISLTPTRDLISFSSSPVPGNSQRAESSSLYLGLALGIPVASLLLAALVICWCYRRYYVNKDERKLLPRDLMMLLGQLNNVAIETDRVLCNFNDAHLNAFKALKSEIQTYKNSYTDSGFLHLKDIAFGIFDKVMFSLNQASTPDSIIEIRNQLIRDIEKVALENQAIKKLYIPKVKEIASILKAKQTLFLQSVLILKNSTTNRDDFCAISDFQIGINGEIRFIYINWETTSIELASRKQKIRNLVIRGSKIFEMLEDGKERKIDIFAVDELYSSIKSFNFLETELGDELTQLIKSCNSNIIDDIKGIEEREQNKLLLDLSIITGSAVQSHSEEFLCADKRLFALSYNRQEKTLAFKLAAGQEGQEKREVKVRFSEKKDDDQNIYTDVTIVGDDIETSTLLNYLTLIILTTICESADPKIIRYRNMQNLLAALHRASSNHADYEVRPGFINYSSLNHYLEVFPSDLRKKFSASRQRLLEVTSEFLSENSYPANDLLNQVVAYAPVTMMVKNQLTEYRKQLTKRCIELETERDRKSGIARTIKAIDGAPILIRDARSCKPQIELGSESFQIIYFNLAAAALDIAEIAMTENKTCFEGEVKERVDNFLDTNYFDNEEIGVLKSRLAKSADQKLKAKIAEELQEKYSKILSKKIQELCEILKRFGIKNPYKALDVAKDYQNYNYDNHNVVTISKVKVEIGGKNVFEKTVIQAEVGCRGLTREQQQEYRAILEEGHGKPAWFSEIDKKPELRMIQQGLIKKYGGKIIAGNHVRPTQLRNAAGIGNYFEKITSVAEDDNSVREILSSFHSGTIANLSPNKSEGYRLSAQNARQCQQFIGERYRLHTNTLNSPWNLGGNDAKLVNQAKKSAFKTGGLETNTPFNLFRIIGNYHLDGVEILLQEIASAIVDNAANNDIKLIKEYLQPARFGDGFKYRINKILRALNDLSSDDNFIINQEAKKILYEAIKLSQIVRDAEKLLKIDPFGENISLNLATRLEILSYKLNNAKNKAESQDGDDNPIKGLKLNFHRLQKMVVMCESGKDRAGTSEHDKSCDALAEEAVDKIIADNPKAQSSSQYTEEEMALIKEEVKSQISTQLALTLHTQNQNGSPLVGGCSNGSYGIKKKEGRLYVPSAMLSQTQDLMAKSADTNKIKKPKTLIRKTKEAGIVAAVAVILTPLSIPIAVTAGYRELTAKSHNKQRKLRVAKMIPGKSPEATSGESVRSRVLNHIYCTVQ